MKPLYLFILTFLIIQLEGKAQCTYLESSAVPNKVVNGNFSSGNIGFTSAYTYSTINPLSEAKYIITTNAANVHFAFSGGDHTTGSGNLMVLNGSSTPSNVWNQTVTVNQNTWYNFSAWFKNIVTKPAYAGAPIATVELWINGVKISRNMSLPDYPDVWKLLDTSWFSGSSTTANLTIRNIGVDLHGNDFAIDDIAFRECCSNGVKTNLNSCIGSNLTLPGSGSGGTFSWSPTTGLSNPSILNPTLITNANSVYILTRTNGSCITRDTFNITVENCCFTCNSLPSTLGNGLVACYPFDGNANDATSNNNHGVVYSATLTNDRFGRPNRAYVFNGSQYIEVPNSPSLSSASTAITFAFWSRISNWVPQSGVNWASVISKSSSTTNCAYRFTIRQDGGSIIHNGKLWDYIPGGMSNALNQWDFYAATVSGTTMKLYKNGNLMGTTTSSTPFTFNNSNPLNLGRDFPGILDYFNGSLDDIRIYNRALSDKEISELFLFTSTITSPSANAGTDINICASDSFQLNGSGNGSMFWSPGLPLADSSKLNTKGRVSSSQNFILTNTYGSCVLRDTVLVNLLSVAADAGPDRQICKRDVIVLNGSGIGSSYSWLPIKNISNNLSLTPSVNPDTTTTYILTVTQGSCVVRDTVTVFVNPIDARILTNDTTFCLGDTIKLIGNATGLSFDWFPKTNILNATTQTPLVFPTAATKYFLSTTDGTCTIVDSVVLSLNNLTVMAGIDTLICAGDSIQLNGIAPMGSTYQWSPSSGLSNAQIYNPFAYPSVRTDYILTATKGNCIGSDTLSILVNSKPSVDAGSDVKYCFGADVKITVNASNYTDVLWKPNTGIDDVKLLNPSFFGPGKRDYILQLSNGKCLVFDTIQVSSNPKVVADFIPDIVNGIAPATIQFTNKSSNANFYQWNFGDNSANSSVVNPSHEFTQVGEYAVWLYAMDSLGCKDSTYKTINVTDIPYLKVPNVFTPDANAINDSFGIVYNASAFEFVSYRIYNRWGGFIYETTFPNGKWWDGTFEGKPCPDGVYFYVLNARSFSKKEFNMSGTVTLLR